MSKKLGIVLGAVMAVGLITSLVAGGALAQGTTPQSQATPQASRPKAGPADGAPGGMNDVAELLGMTLDQIWAERVQGKTLADLAKEKGVDTQQLVDALVTSQKTMLDQAVTDNHITQAQADKWLEWYKQAAALQLTEPYGLGFGLGAPSGVRGGPGGHGGLGGMRGPKPEGQNGNTPPQSPVATPTQ